MTLFGQPNTRLCARLRWMLWTVPNINGAFKYVVCTLQIIYRTWSCTTSTIQDTDLPTGFTNYTIWHINENSEYPDCTFNYNHCILWHTGRIFHNFYRVYQKAYRTFGKSRRTIRLFKCTCSPNLLFFTVTFFLTTHQLCMPSLATIRSGFMNEDGTFRIAAICFNTQTIYFRRLAIVVLHNMFTTGHRQYILFNTVW